jgi:hypothetical protein
VLFVRLVVCLYTSAGETYHDNTRGKENPSDKEHGSVENEASREEEVTTKKHLSEQQAVTIDADKPPIDLHLKHADIAPPLTFICRRCGAVCQWEEPHGFDCQVATTEQQRERMMGNDAEAGKK